MTLEEAAGKVQIDIRGSLARFGGNEALYVRFLKKFLDDKSFGEMKEALKEKDCGKMERAAHTLKGVSANLGITLLAEKCDSIVKEMRGETKCMALEQEDFLCDCEREYEKVWKALRELD